MHFCGIIIKNKNIKIEEARKEFGEVLLENNICDWYSTDNYRERLFDNDLREIDLNEFEKIFDKWTNEYNPHCICILNKYSEIELQDYILPSEFYEFYYFEEERKVLLENYKNLYKKAIKKWFEKLNKNNIDYNVCLLDYHN